MPTHPLGQDKPDTIQLCSLLHPAHPLLPAPRASLDPRWSLDRHGGGAVSWVWTKQTTLPHVPWPQNSGGGKDHFGKYLGYNGLVGGPLLLTLQTVPTRAPSRLQAAPSTISPWAASSAEKQREEKKKKKRSEGTQTRVAGGFWDRVTVIRALV